MNDLEWFSNDGGKTNTKEITSTNHNRSKQRDAMNQSQFLANTRKLLKVREKSRIQGALGFGFCFSLVEKLTRDF